MGARSFLSLCRHGVGPRDQRELQGRAALARARDGQLRDGFGDRALGGLRILHQRLHDHLDRHRIVLGMPAVVVGDEGERHVTDLRFAGQLRFLQVRHADDVHAPRAIQPGLGKGRKLRPFHAHVGAAAMHVRTHGGHGIGADLGELGADGMRERDVRGEAVAEERADATLRSIEKLIRHDDVERRVFLLEAADRARRNNPLHAKQLEAEDVRAEVELRREEPMSRAMPREKRDPLPAQRADQIRTRRIAEWGRQRLFFAVGQLGHVVQAAAANHTYLNVMPPPPAVWLTALRPSTLSRSAHATCSTYLLPSFSRMYPAAMSGSCSNRMRYSRSMASRRKARLKLSVSSGKRS